MDGGDEPVCHRLRRALSLCIQEEQVVGNDNIVSYGRRRLQIPPSPLRPHSVAKVRVRHYPDGSYGLFHRPRCLARY